MKVIRLEAENIKRLQAVEIIPDENDNLVVIGGNNGNGKSSTLDAIEYALGGKSRACKKPVKRGKAFARTVVEFPKFTVTRKFKSNGESSLVVEGKDGAEFSSPQKFLNKYFNKLSFEPIEFLEQDNRKQVEVLKDLLNLDFEKLNSERQKVYEERTDLNRSIRSLSTLLERTEFHLNIPTEEISVAELGKTLTKQSEVLKENERLRDNLSSLKLLGKQKHEQINEIGGEIYKLKLELKEKQEEFVELKSTYVEDKKMIENLVDPNIKGIQTQMDDAEIINIQVRQNIQYLKNKDQVEKESRKEM